MNQLQKAESMYSDYLELNGECTEEFLHDLIQEQYKAIVEMKDQMRRSAA